MVKEYNLDGVRVDTIPEVEKPFWTEFNDASGVFNMGENFSHVMWYVSDYQNYMDSLLNYPMYSTVNDVFGNG